MNMLENLKLEKEKGMSADIAVKWLHDSGASKAQSIVELVKVYSVSMSEAKTLVHEHEVWSDVKSRDDKFQAELLDKLDD